MTFGAFYDQARYRDYWSDNVGVFAQIRAGHPRTTFRFRVQLESWAPRADRAP